MHITLYHGDCLRVAALFCSGLLLGVPRTPAVGGTAGNIQVLGDPDFPTTILVVRQIVASTLCPELLTQPVEQWREISLRECLVLLPRGYDCRLEFLFVEFRWVGVVGLGRIDSLHFFAVHAH